MGKQWDKNGHKMAQGPKVTQKKVPKVPDFFKKKIYIFSSKYFRFCLILDPLPPPLKMKQKLKSHKQNDKKASTSCRNWFYIDIDMN